MPRVTAVIDEKVILTNGRNLAEYWKPCDIVTMGKIKIKVLSLDESRKAKENTEKTCGSLYL